MQEEIFDYQRLTPLVEGALNEAFPKAGIFLSEVYNRRVHVEIVSTKFNGMSAADRQTYVYDALRSKLKGDSVGVSLVSAYGVDEL